MLPGPHYWNRAQRLQPDDPGRLARMPRTTPPCRQVSQPFLVNQGVMVAARSSVRRILDRKRHDFLAESPQTFIAVSRGGLFLLQRGDIDAHACTFWDRHGGDQNDLTVLDVSLIGHCEQHPSAGKCGDAGHLSMSIVTSEDSCRSPRSVFVVCFELEVASIRDSAAKRRRHVAQGDSPGFEIPIRNG